jgi:hypothetical protein
LRGKPLLKTIPLEIGEPYKTAILGNPLQLPHTFASVRPAKTGSLHVHAVRGEMSGERRSLVFRDGSLARRQYLRAHPFGFALQIGKHILRGGFVTAASRHNLHNAGAVSVLGEIVTGLDQEPVPSGVQSLLRGRDRGLAPFALRILPPYKAPAVAGEHFGPLGQRFRKGLLEYRPHSSPTLSFSQFQSEITGEPVSHIEPKRLLAGQETRNTHSLNAGFPFQDKQRLAAFDNRLAEDVTHTLSLACHVR